MRRWIAALAAFALLVLAPATPAFAGEPDPGHADLFAHDPGDARVVLDWHFASAAYPAWFRSNVRTELNTNWQDRSTNNSNVPRFADGGDNVGGGSVVYLNSASSPCTGSTTWIGCNPAGGTRSFLIYVRLLPSASAPTWMWFHRDNTCQDLYDGNPNPNDGYPTSVCFSVLRVVAHEATHLTVVRSHYDTGADNETFMQGTTPTPNGSPDNWNRRSFLPCDAAAAQLEYGALDPAGPFADCFDTKPGDGVKGLNAALTLTTPTSTSRCWNSTASAAGRLALADVNAYEDLRNTPLEGRTVRIDRRPAGATTWTTGAFSATATDASGSNWSRVLTSTTAGSFTYRALFVTTATEPAVNSSNEVTWTVTWTTLGCPS